jgi:tagaturonate reductase
MLLSKALLNTIEKNRNSNIPDSSIFELPEKILQFGTGILLRGLPGYLIDKANRKGIFNGRIVVVKSTLKGDTTAFEKQDGLYTICVRGIQDEIPAQQDIICSSISRVLNANADWNSILAYANKPEMQIIISNTTEAGIVLMEGDFGKENIAPVSFPGKLLAFLLERFKAFNGNESAGMVIIPTELIVNNGDCLKQIVLALANQQELPPEFINWLQLHNYFCNSLVDCIVPGQPSQDVKLSIEKELGYQDDLMITTEQYRLWAIEGGDKVRTVLSFAKSDEAVVITEDIKKYRELKLRLLNGSHSLACTLALFAGFTTMKQAMDNAAFENYIKHLMLQEIVPAIISNDISKDVANEFALKVLDRFRNPFIEHQLLDITKEYSSKIASRVLPLMMHYHNNELKIPQGIVTGFAAFLLFMKAQLNAVKNYIGRYKEFEYKVNDSKAGVFAVYWNNNTDKAIESIFSDITLWGYDLNKINGFKEDVKKALLSLENNARHYLDTINYTNSIMQ